MSDFLDEDPAPPTVQDLRTQFDVLPLRKALEYVVQEARKHLAAGHNDHFVAVGRIAQAALTWQKLDELGRFEEAEQWLRRIPR